jgi:hypothetical protein
MHQYKNILIFLILFGVNNIFGVESDNPEVVMQLAKEGTLLSNNIAVLTQEANNFLNRLSTDRVYAARLLDAVSRNDQAGVLAVMKETLPRGIVSDLRMHSGFEFSFSVSNGAAPKKVQVCVSSSSACGGKRALVDVK